MRVFLTGGGGFLGGVVARKLVLAGHSVRSFSRGRYPRLEALGVIHVSGDLGDRSAVIAAAKGCDAVIHTAAKAGVWGDTADYRRANLDGTRNVLAACRAHQIPKLVYTSTPSVTHTGRDIEGADESLPYTEEPRTAYVATKTEAERAVIDAQSERLSVVALRPHLIWGPGDPHLVPRIVARCRRGRIVLPNGGEHLIDTVYVDNAADAHLAALQKLGPGAACAGKAYFISNDEPRTLRDMTLGILRASGVENPRVIPIPTSFARAVGAILEAGFRFGRIEREPPLTRFTAEILSTAHWYSIRAAKRDLDWTPAISIDEGLERLEASFVAERAALGSGVSSPADARRARTSR